MSGNKVKKATPLPLQQLIPMTFVLLNESLCSSMLLPFVPDLIARMLDIPTDQAGYATGWLVGAFMFGQVLGSKFWGWLSDQYGRRLPLISGLFVSGLMMLGFGLSSNLYLSILFRLLHGLFNGNILVAKTMMADITDKTNESKGFAFVSLCYGIGTLIGPTLGGFLYDPYNSNYFDWLNLSKENLFTRYPALLPSAFIFVYTTVGMLTCTFFVQETNKNAKPLPSWVKIICPCMIVPSKQFVPNTPPEEGKSPRGREGSDDSRSDNNSESGELDEVLSNLSITFPVGAVGMHGEISFEDVRKLDFLMEQSLAAAANQKEEKIKEESLQLQLQRSFCGDDLDFSLNSLNERRKSGASPRDQPREEVSPVEEDGTIVIASSDPPARKRFGYKQAFERPISRFLLVVYMLLCAADTVFSEALVLWAKSSLKVGGMRFTVKETSLLLIANSPPCVISNLVFPRVSGMYPNKMDLLRVVGMSCGIAVFIVPFLTKFPNFANRPEDSDPYQVNRIIVYMGIATCMAIRQCAASWGYGLVTMLTARSAPVGHIGSIMGINQSCGSLMRAIVPPIADTMFAWSVSGNHFFPFNYFLTFLVSSVIYFTCWARSFTMETFEDGSMKMASESGKTLTGEMKKWFQEKFRF